MRQPGFEEEGVEGWELRMGGRGVWRREKKSLMSWASRLRVPLEVRREIRPSVGIGLVAVVLQW